jgi:hypothetical protein
VSQTYSSAKNAELAKEQQEHAFNQAMAETGQADAANPLVYLMRVIRDSFSIRASGERVVMQYRVPHREAKRLWVFRER